MEQDELKKLGELLLQWHGGMSDPIYAVGSFFVGGSTYPAPAKVFEARDGIERLLRRHESLLEKYEGAKEQLDDVNELKAILGGLSMYIEWQEIVEVEDDA